MRVLLMAGLAAGLAGLAVSVFGIVVQVLPRRFSAAQQEQIMTWEVAKRWRSWPAGRIFPRTIPYELPGRAFGGGSPLSLTARRVGIAPQSSCRAAVDPAVGDVLARHGCQAVLRATYEDTTQTLAVTVGVAVLPAFSAARESATSLGTVGEPASGVRAVSFRRTTTARFGDRSHKIAWDGVAGPYLVFATVGYADGRPWISSGHDSYTEAEMLSLASGTAQGVAAHLGAMPPPARCPGSPSC
jgi:hypothetical protein